MAEAAPESAREIALDRLSRGESARKAALASGVSKTTIRRWAKQPEFEALLKARTLKRKEAAAQVIDGSAAHVAKKLIAYATGKEKCTGPQVQAAIKALEFAGMRPTTRVEITSNLGEIADTEIAALLAAEQATMAGPGVAEVH